MLPAQAFRQYWNCQFGKQGNGGRISRDTNYSVFGLDRKDRLIGEGFVTVCNVKIGFLSAYASSRQNLFSDF
jgi:hypothetical protein